jgi:hypothetical protein
MRNLLYFSLLISRAGSRKGTRPSGAAGYSDYKTTENIEDDPFYQAFRKIYMPEDLDWIPIKYLPGVGYLALCILSFYVGQFQCRTTASDIHNMCARNFVTKIKPLLSRIFD